MILKYLRAIYQGEPVLINGFVAALLAPVANLAGLSIPTNILIGYIAIVLGAALGTRSQVSPKAKAIKDRGNLESTSA